MLEIDARPNKNGRGLFLIERTSAFFAGTLMLMWPAIWNGYPLLYPDSVTYLESGGRVSRALFLHRFSEYYGMRSFIYSLGILPFHWNVSLWPVAALQALITGYVIWLVVRSILPEHAERYFVALCVALSFLTSIGWFVSMVMPDILGPVLYLCVYLHVFAPERMSRMEKAVILAIAWWAVASHATHLIIATGLCVLLLSLSIFNHYLRHRRRALVEIGAVLLLAVAAQMSLHAFLYGRPSLNGDRPPFLMARIIADGPGRWYLQSHCPDPRFSICSYVNRLPATSDDFLWAADGVWEGAPEATRAHLVQEEMPFVAATLRTYPREQMLRSIHNFWEQLTAYHAGVDANEWMLRELQRGFPSVSERVMQTRQSRDDMPSDFFEPFQDGGVIGALALMAMLGHSIWRYRRRSLAGLGVVIIFVIIANAFVLGAMSNVEDRYEARVIWLLPLLAMLVGFDSLAGWMARLKKSREESWSLEGGRRGEQRNSS